MGPSQWASYCERESTSTSWRGFGMAGRVIPTSTSLMLT